MPQLFVVGTSRTGTSALTRYLSMHPRVLVLNERYKSLAKEVNPEHFKFSRLRENVEEESRMTAKKFEPLLSSKREWRLKWIGDKGQPYARNLETVAENNPGCVFALTLRDPVAVVASAIEKHGRSYPDRDEDPVVRAVEGYNEVLRAAVQFVRTHPKVPFVIIEYESFYRAPGAYEPLLSAVLRLDMRKTVAKWKTENEKFASSRKRRPISNEEAGRVRTGIDRAALDWLKAYGVGQRRAAHITSSR